MSLTRRALVAIALIALLAIAGLWTEDELLAGLWEIPAALFTLGLALEGFLRRIAAVAMSVELPPQVHLGRTERLEWRFSTPRGPVTLEYALGAPAGVDFPDRVEVVSIAGGSEIRRPFEITPLVLGKLAWPAVSARIRGIFGLAWWPRQLAIDRELTVVPDLLRRSSASPSLARQGASARTVRGAGAEIHELREYRPGDPLRAIDWKASARAQRLIARDFTEDQHLEVMLAVDAGRGSALWTGRLDRLGHYVNFACRFAEHVVSRDDQVGVIAFADQLLATLPPGRGAPAVVRLRGALRELRPIPRESNALIAAARLRTLCRQRALVILLTDLDDAGAASQLARAVKLLMPKHVPVIASIANPELVDLERARAERWLDPYIALAATEQLGRMRANAFLLRQLGVPVVVSPAQLLEESVFALYDELKARRQV
ncbi:MAG: DUF58 domain-containing protein [Steroidobacterales bacterium]